MAAQLHESNGNSEVERLSLLVQQLESECDRLRQALARSEAERNHYLKAIHAYERARIELEDVDIAELERSSAGPVELIEY
jgi:hypothetical protein